MDRIRVFLTNRWVLILVFVLGSSLTAGKAWWSQTQQLREAADLMDRRALTVSQALGDAVDTIVGDTRSAAGLFLASRDVTESEFEAFVENAGQHPGSSGLAFVTAVDPSEIDRFLFEARFSNPEFEMFGFEADGTRYFSSPGAERLLVVRYFQEGGDSEHDLTGFDAASDPVWFETINSAEREGSPQLSRITQLFGARGRSGFLVVVPVEKDGELLGHIVSLASLEGLMSSAMSESLGEVVVWRIRDVTSEPALAASNDPLERRSSIETGGRSWSLSVIPTVEARQTLTDSGVARDLALGLLVTFLAMFAVHEAIGSFRFRRATSELIRVTEEKDEFLAAVSHALRTPMTVVLGMAEILEESTVDSDADTREYVGLLLAESRQLASLVDDLLLSGRLDADALAIRPELVDLRWEMERLVCERPPASATDLAVLGDAQAWTDPLRLRRVLFHLYSNAMSHGGDTVTISIAEVPDGVVIKFVDDGPGVPAGSLGLLFDSPTGKKVTVGGPSTLGLGLRLSKRLAAVLGGDLSYQRLDDQTIFTLSLPTVPGAVEIPGDGEVIRVAKGG